MLRLNKLAFLLAMGLVPGVLHAQGPAISPATAVTPTPEASPLGWMPKLTMPKIEMPKITMPKMEMPKLPENAFGPVKESAGKVVSGTKKAWQGAKEILSFGSGGGKETNPQIASREQPSAWNQLFKGQEEPQPPRTIGEFMAGERPK
ncbi:hypothetical protein [Adhaeretor mobilis]|uniref:Uncharacterized protein n=1 Tax=Adhaeretor mobilis TaxID=1930276 RepID=A0A517MZ33_9BACT|nr:hypothetical protein [Adhaeretor mobilis]QDT00142.1 hypothetical protein HG15A2_34770 [Adhaeretor mobilis]